MSGRYSPRPRQFPGPEQPAKGERSSLSESVDQPVGTHSSEDPSHSMARQRDSTSRTGVSMDTSSDMNQHLRDQSLKSPVLISNKDKETLCKSCVTAGESPNWQARFSSARSNLHCARCKAHHPRCLFSKSQRDSNIPHSIRYCIGHEGVLRLCEHKAVSWRQILALSNSIMRQKIGKKYRVIRCFHNDHAGGKLAGITEGLLCSRFRQLGLGLVSLAGTKDSYPTLTVGFMDSSKEFSLVLSWEGHISLELGEKSASRRGGPELQEQLQEKLEALREIQGKYICPEPDPERRLEEMVLESLTGHRNVLHRKSVEGKSRAPVGTARSKGPRSSSLNQHSTRVDEDARPLVTNGIGPPMIKNGEISGKAKFTWGWGVGDQPAHGRTSSGSDSEIEPDIVETTADKTSSDGNPLTTKGKEKDIHVRAYEYQPKHHPHSKGITDSLKIRPCRHLNCTRNHCKPKHRKPNFFEQVKEWFHDRHGERQSPSSHTKTVCLSVKYKRRLAVGDDLHGANVRDVVRFQNWMSVLDPDSYKLWRDDEGEGVYWCWGTELDELRSGCEHNNGAKNTNHDGNNIAGRQEADDVDAGGAGGSREDKSTIITNLDTDIMGNLDLDGETRKVQCLNYHRHFNSRISGLNLKAEDLTKTCPRLKRQSRENKHGAEGVTVPTSNLP
ncbi:hypothetical protein V8F20_003011 [Naviculisporaceae sp. PSN 640]